PGPGDSWRIAVPTTVTAKKPAMMPRHASTVSGLFRTRPAGAPPPGARTRRHALITPRAARERAATPLHKREDRARPASSAGAGVPGVIRVGGGLRDGLGGQPDDPEVVGEVRRLVVARRLEESESADDDEREREQPEKEPVGESTGEQEPGAVAIALVRAERRVHPPYPPPP